jgi:hypothetical protein
MDKFLIHPSKRVLANLDPHNDQRTPTSMAKCNDSGPIPELIQAIDECEAAASKRQRCPGSAGLTKY